MNLDSATPFPVLGDSTGAFISGDADADGARTINDAVRGLRVVFLGDDPGCEDAHDVNDDGKLNLADPVALLEFIFRRGAMPTGPSFFCMFDSTEDELDCVSYTCPIPP